MADNRRLAAATCAAILALAWTLVFGLVGALALPADGGGSPRYATDRILVKFTSDAAPATIHTLSARFGASERRRIQGLGVRVMSLPRGSDPKAVAAALAKDPNVEYAEPDYVVRASLTPNDTYYSLQWGPPKISAPAAWDVTTGSTEVTIAIIDTGIDPGQPDLAGRVVAGYDFANADSDPSDDHGHGTACAGVIGANGNNGQGVAGLDWSARLLAVKVLDASGSGYDSAVADGITYAVDHGARVISMSLGGSEAGETLQNAIDYAYGKGALLVAASGNESSGTVTYPAAFPHVLAVGALDNADALASFSNFGAAQDVVAPGVSIATTYLNGSYVYYSGTSAATPFVSGVAGLLLAKNPTLTADTMEAAIRAGAVDLGSAGWDQTFGWGRIDAAKALNAVTGPDTVIIGTASASPNPAVVGQAVAFAAAGTDSLGHALAYQWTEGTTVLSTSRTFATSLLAAGTHVITVRATCAQGTSATRTITVTVNVVDSVTISSVSGTPNPATVGQEVTLACIAADSSGHTLTYVWTEGSATLSTARSFATSALTVGTHTLTVRASCPGGKWASKSVAVRVNPVDAVTVKSASATPNPAATGQAVTFTASATDALGHSLTYRWAEGGVVLSTSRTFSTAQLATGPHEITVRATCSKGVVGERTVSVQVNAVPPLAPTVKSIGATPYGTGARISVAWTNVANETGYVVQRATDASFTQNVFETTANVNVESLVQTGLGRNVTYWYRVRAVNKGGASAWSAARSVSTAVPSAPALLTLSTTAGTTSDQVTISWTDVPDEQTYTLQRATNSTFTSGLNTLTGLPAGVTTRVQTVSRYTTFYYRVRARNAFGDSPWSNDLHVTTP